MKDFHLGQLRLLDVIAIAVYALVGLYIGWRTSRRQEVSTEEFFVAGRGAGSLLVGISMVATLLSTISYLSTPGEVIKNGPGIYWCLLHIPISFGIIGYLVIPHVMKHKVTSGYELLQERFGMAIRQMGALLFVLIRITWLGFIIFTCGWAVSKITGVPLPYFLVFVGVITTIYTVMGGVRAVMITDVLQFVIMVAGGLLAIGYVTWKCEGVSWWPDWSSTQIASWKEVKFVSVNPFDRVTVVSAILCTCYFWISVSTSDQLMIQRYLCTRNAHVARRSLLNGMLGDAIISSVLAVVGLALLGLYLRFPGLLPDPSQSVGRQADQLFPHFIGSILPAGFSGLLVAALFAAAMSSLSSGISAISSVLITDFRSVFARGLADDQKSLVRRARGIGVWIGAVAIGLSSTNFLVAKVFPDANLFELGFKISEFFAAPLFVLFLLAFFVPFSTPAGAWTAVVVGIVSGVLFSYWKPIVGQFTETGEFSFLWISPATACCSLLSAVVVSGFTTPRARAAHCTVPVVYTD